MAGRQRRSAVVIAVLLIVAGAALVFVTHRGYLAPYLPSWFTRAALPLERIELPAGFRIHVYARGVEGARSLAQGPPGVVFVGTRAQGKVYALVDREGDRRAGEVVTLAEGLDLPNGVAYRDGALFVAEVSRVLRYDLPPGSLRLPEPVVVSDRFPGDRRHGRKLIRFGPDGKLYVSVGAPCNVCEPPDGRFATLQRMNADGSRLEIFARGVRNSVGFDWHPATRELWFTDSGRDWMGDDLPPDELNHAPIAGMHFGFPYCHGRDIPDPELGAVRSCADLTPPALLLGPHVAALGMRFYDARAFPERYRGGIFIAEHGSWNRSVPAGYRVTFVRFEAGRPASYEVFAKGWLHRGAAWGRPVDVEVLRDGSLLVSDDEAGVVYRITYDG
jgi:glucose/arabinose dehydrogenase